MKTILFAVFLGLGTLAQAARVCPNNDFKACLSVLQKAHRADNGIGFIGVYDDICASNSKFKCTKVTVMGDPHQTQKELAQEKPQAAFFQVQQDDGKYLYTFERKDEKKTKAGGGK